MDALLYSQSSRRQWMMGTAKALLGVGLASSSLDKVHAAGSTAAVSAHAKPAKHIIYLYMRGGMSHLDTFDPRPQNAEVNGATETIASNVDGIQVSKLLPLMSKQMHHVAVVQSLHSTQGAHEQGNYYMHTSYTMRATVRHPSMGAWLEKFHERGNPTLPGSFMIGSDSRHPGAGFFESKFAPMMISNPIEGVRDVRQNRMFASESSFAEQLQVSAALDRKFRERYPLQSVRAHSDMYDDAVKLMRSQDLAVFDLNAEAEGLRNAYGRNSFGQGCLLARRLVESGVKFIEVSMNGWDTHNSNFESMTDLAKTLDDAMGTLLKDLEQRGLLESTLVVLATEFGRTPAINLNDGRDHHAEGFTCLLAGANIKGGIQYGLKDERGGKVLDKEVSIPDFNATIAYAAGIPLHHTLYSPSKRPFTVADKGRPILDLFA